MLAFRLMTAADIPFGMHLKERAGWNQTEADWRRFLALAPAGCFIAERNGRGVGSVVVFRFETVAWIAMVLVDPAARGQGIGTRLMEHALASLDERIVSVRLDATPLGRPIYEKLGFVAEYELRRFECKARPPGGVTPRTGIDTVTARDLPAVAALDRRATGTIRTDLLTGLAAETPASMRAIYGAGGIAGFAWSRPGSAAGFLGPVIIDRTADAEVGRALCADGLERLAGRKVFTDIPVDNHAAIAWALAAGFRIERPLLRMCRGPQVHDRPDMIWGSSGPEKG